jgi:hypothetical protein
MVFLPSGFLLKFLCVAHLLCLQHDLPETVMSVFESSCNDVDDCSSNSNFTLTGGEKCSAKFIFRDDLAASSEHSFSQKGYGICVLMFANNRHKILL